MLVHLVVNGFREPNRGDSRTTGTSNPEVEARRAGRPLGGSNIQGTPVSWKDCLWRSYSGVPEVLEPEELTGLIVGSPESGKQTRETTRLRILHGERTHFAPRLLGNFDADGRILKRQTPLQCLPHRRL